MKMLNIILSTLFLIHFLEAEKGCKSEADDLKGRVKKKQPVMVPTNEGMVEISWRSLLEQGHSNCLMRVEIYEGSRKLGGYGDDGNIKKESFQIKLDICKNNYNSFRIKFFLADKTDVEEHKVESRYFKYSPPEYFPITAILPYCLTGRNIRIPLVQNITTPALYRHCIEMVEICECRQEHDCEECDKVKKDDMMDYNRTLQNTTTILRLDYFRTDPEKVSGRISTTSFLKLVPDHCDSSLRTEGSSLSFGSEGSSLSTKVLIICVGGGVSLILMILILLTWLVVRMKKRKKKKDSIDINPDYGYEGGEEYEESAIREANLDYACSVDDPEYIETGVVDTNVEYGNSTDDEEDSDEERENV